MQDKQKQANKYNQADDVTLTSHTLEPIEITTQPQSHRELWLDLIKETDDMRKDVDEYRRSKMPILEVPPHPIIDHLNETVFPVLNNSLLKMLQKVKNEESQIFTEGHTYLNSLNFIAEYLWNMNPNHPERKENWTEISNIVWS